LAIFFTLNGILMGKNYQLKNLQISPLLIWIILKVGKLQLLLLSNSTSSLQSHYALVILLLRQILATTKTNRLNTISKIAPEWDWTAFKKDWNVAENIDNSILFLLLLC
jgi:hypothetical protein